MLRIPPVRPFQCLFLILFLKTEGGTGHVGFICHKQPTLERHLRDAMTSSGFCQLRSNCTVIEIQQDEAWTYCRYRDEDGEVHSIRSRFFVGADGKTGFTRKKYLEPLGIQMEQAHEYFKLNPGIQGGAY